MANFITPWSWNTFQEIAGASVSKRKLYADTYRGEKSILEIGCATGNIAKQFLNYPDISYTGIDIDGEAIAFAKDRFKNHTNFTFVHTSLEEIAKTDQTFELVLFAGILHHVEPEESRRMLEMTRGLVSAEGRVLVMDPLSPKDDDSLMTKLYMKVERGQYVESEEKTLSFLQSLSSLEVRDWSVHYISPIPYARPECVRMGFCELSPLSLR